MKILLNKKFKFSIFFLFYSRNNIFYDLENIKLLILPDDQVVAFAQAWQMPGLPLINIVPQRVNSKA